MALGAKRTNVVRMILSEAAKLVTLSVFGGLLVWFGLARLVASMLFGVSSYDPLTFAGVAVLLSAVTLIACFIPAHRASRVDPMVALRHE